MTNGKTADLPRKSGPFVCAVPVAHAGGNRTEFGVEDIVRLHGTYLRAQAAEPLKLGRNRSAPASSGRRVYSPAEEGGPIVSSISTRSPRLSALPCASGRDNASGSPFAARLISDAGPSLHSAKPSRLSSVWPAVAVLIGPSRRSWKRH